MLRKSAFFFLLTLFLIGPTAAQAQESTAKDGPAKGKTKPDRPLQSEDKIVTTQHEITVRGARLAYTARTGILVLKDEKDQPTANVFFIAYTLNGQQASQRPITFAFNGGPGSSSVWLHLGVLGPRRVLLQDDGKAPAPPYRLVDNDFTLLDQTDLVFIDPVSTGYSRPAPGKEGKLFHGVQQDLESVGEFVRLYLTRYERWGSPKFLCGESYGTTRASALSNHLQSRHGINLNGIILVSAVLNFQTLAFDEGNDLPYILFLPSYTATAWYHKKRNGGSEDNLPALLDEARKFAQGEYTLALMKGDKLGKEERTQIARKVARFTGLSEKFVLQSNLRIAAFRYFRELLRDERRTVGRYDSRFLGKEGDTVREFGFADPSYAAVQGPYSACVNQYLRGELKYESDQVYEILTGKVQPWDFGPAKNRYLNVSTELRNAISQNNHLKVFVANGYYDLATPFFASEYTFSHLGLDPSLAGNIKMGYYEAGHMMYINRPSLEQLRRDLRAFFSSALTGVATTTTKVLKN